MRAFNALLAGCAVLASASFVNAQTVIRITGSSAYRGATHNAILNTMATGKTYGYTGSSLGSASQAIFAGTVGGESVIIKTSWSGSVAGVQTVSQGLNVNFLPNSTTQSSGGTSGATTGTEAGIPDVAMSDTFQNATPFKSPALSFVTVGVVPFKWVVNRGLTSTSVAVDTTAGSNIGTVADTTGLSAGMTITGNANIPAASKIGAVTSGTTFTIVKVSDGTAVTTTTAGSGVNTVFAAPAPFNNITPQLAQAVWGSGSAELSLFTGSNADIGKKVFAIGRDPDSGTRLTAFAEAGIGVSATVTQFEPTAVSGVLNSIRPWPQQTVNGITFTPGNGGYSSGGTLATQMGILTNSFEEKKADNTSYAPARTRSGYFVTYLSTGDATTAINAGAKELAYNGVTYSLAAVQQGLYTFWGYEHLMYPASFDSATSGSPEVIKKTVATTLANQIKDVDATVLLSSMKVQRTSDGGLVTQNF